MKKALTIILATAILMTSLTACASNQPAPVQNAQTLPAPVQGAPSAPPAQGITVNYKDFNIVDPNNLPDAKKQMLESYKTSKGYTYWQEDGDFFIAVFAGQCPSAGYSIAVKSIEDNEGKTNILVDVVQPKGMAAAVITYPYVVVKVTGITDNFNIKDTNGNSYSALRAEK